ncbi:MAG: hypothetical protein A2Y62_05525 [Candidatus Fischerbacteria bacterium RBG_13_37_8]|uniref:histidine kinase n=1 Tax=Candidatus Fischerbacteria bacterium RBG_13_37_8 TaxID=1817863 RepID=A0A1F5VYG3_9BACT|nr:MAG: hypothetical protein A2Y62_05525 [Candidatus Fischerbacteria bacterium RBG_13_37_8]
MKKTIFFKFLIIFFSFILLYSLLIYFLAFSTIKQHYIETLSGNLANLELTLIPSIIPYLEKNDYQYLDSLVKNTGQQIKTRITIINIDGIVLADSQKDPHTMENHKNRPEISAALENTAGTSLRFSSTVHEEMLYVALPIHKNNEIIAVIRTSLYLKDINNLISKLQNKILHIFIVLIIISFIAAIIISRSLSNPIEEITFASQEVAKGNFDTRIHLKDKNELKELADNFNYMTAHIKNLFDELSHQKEELNSIISSLQESLMVINRKGKIVLCNESFKKIVNTPDVEQKHYFEVFREPEFNELIKQVWERKLNISAEIEFNDRIYLCSAAPLALRNEAVFILHDITDVYSLKKMKKDLIANASHELRTPLTAIKGFLETLEQETSPEQQHYIDVIKKHTDRLIKIVQDLLSLSCLEDKTISRESEKILIAPLIEKILPLFQDAAANKNLVFQYKAEANLPPITGDSFQLEQLFINLIENAVNYTEQGTISINATRENHSIKIEISDTGIGIPDEDLSRIFERFYVVDKSRSRKTGGTGLGLSIVKHIVLMHNGTIHVESKQGKGSTFLIRLPIGD